MNPDIVILDEPFNGLSPKYRALITQIVNQLHHAGKTIIISSHHFNQIRSLVDRVYVFSEDHTITREITADQLEEMPRFIECYGRHMGKEAHVLFRHIEVNHVGGAVVRYLTQESGEFRHFDISAEAFFAFDASCLNWLLVW